MSSFVPVVAAAAVRQGESHLAEVSGRRIGIFNCGGTYHAIDDVCTHAEAFLHEGSFDRVRCTVECPLHGSEFDLRTGAVLTPPADVPAEVFPVRVSGGAIEVALPAKGGSNG